jgi:hypothetical protein
LNFDLQENMISDIDNKILWTYYFLKDQENLKNLIEHLKEEDDKIRTIDSFNKTRDYLLLNHPEYLM